jgi:hypothetical protein
MLHVKVIAESANHCLRTVVECCHSIKLARLLFETKASRAVLQRRRGAECILLALEVWPSTVWARSQKDLGSFIEKTVSDADKHVREIGRQCYWVWEGYYPDRAAT